MKIKVVTFNDNIALGTEFVPLRVIAQGDRFGKGTMSLSNYQDRFVQIDFRYPDAAKNLTQFVPWSRVDSCIFDESPDDKSNEASAKPGKGKAK
jgi:hypothetical protein